MDELKIKELAKYYVARYHLETRYHADSYEGADDGLGTYIQAIRRMMLEIHIGQTTLWDSIKPDQRDRRISIAEFEKYCFLSLAEYIEKNCDNYDKEKLAKDIEPYQRADDLIQKHNRSLENGDNQDNEPFVTQTEIENKGYQMMLTALYDIFFTPFNWGDLARDMQASIVLDTGYNPSVTKQNVIAQTRLENPYNYIGKRRPAGTYVHQSKKKRQ